MSAPEPRTATVRPAWRAPRWAAASTPRASPLMTTSPAAASSRASSMARRVADTEHSRAPTMAIAGRARTSATPDDHRTGGASGSSSTSRGYRGLVQGIAVRPAAAPAASQPSAREADDAVGSGPAGQLRDARGSHGGPRAGDGVLVRASAPAGAGRASRIMRTARAGAPRPLGRRRHRECRGVAEEAQRSCATRRARRAPQRR